MYRPYVSLAVTAVALAFAAAQFNAATATPRVSNTPQPKSPRAFHPIDLSCAKGFASNATMYPGKGHIYECSDRMAIKVDCMNGYTPNKSLTVYQAWNGSGWNIELKYSCASQPR